MSRRAKWVIYSVGIVVFLVAGLLVALKLTSPSQISVPEVEEKEIPSDWVSETPSQNREPDISSSPQPESRADTTNIPAATAAAPFETTGTLAFLSGDKSFGVESYTIISDKTGIRLESNGEFRFKIVLATISVSFEQTLRTDTDKRLTNYTLDFRAPLGLGQNIEAQLTADQVTVIKNKEETQIPLGSRPVFTVGTFSTYALIPVLFVARPELGSEVYDLLAFGGPPNTQSTNKGMGAMTVKRDGAAILKAGDTSVPVDRYQVSGDLGQGYLYARDKEFLAFATQGDDEDKSLLVYRTDFFPQGVQILK